MVEERKNRSGPARSRRRPTADMLAQTLQFLLPMGLGHRSMPAAGVPFHHGGSSLQSIVTANKRPSDKDPLGHAQDVFTYLSTRKRSIRRQ